MTAHVVLLAHPSILWQCLGVMKPCWHDHWMEQPSQCIHLLGGNLVLSKFVVHWWSLFLSKRTTVADGWDFYPHHKSMWRTERVNGVHYLLQALYKFWMEQKVYLSFMLFLFIQAISSVVIPFLVLYIWLKAGHLGGEILRLLHSSSLPPPPRPHLYYFDIVNIFFLCCSTGGLFNSRWNKWNTFSYLSPLFSPTHPHDYKQYLLWKNILSWWAVQSSFNKHEVFPFPLLWI